ncbi:VPS9 domain-containing protein 1 isoform X4 [Oncorhynchus mykiss]|uniref:VPS9 domain-containing protein 1 isoform X4 n=1 Tax=Oncorhynchus mykiss TaxID=8022 RepID=UPI001878104F|nr:VPS9 domain-containing protein 1 isoform X4 [Oncorhynchus mykiss]
MQNLHPERLVTTITTTTTMAAAGADMKPLQHAMKIAKVAIQLDAGNRHKEAYCEYLRSINFITHSLLEDAVSRQGEIVEVEKMLRLAEQCLERAKSSFIGRRDEPATPISYTTPINLAALSLTTALAVSPGKIVSPQPQEPVIYSGPKHNPRPGQRKVLSEGGGEVITFLPPEIFQSFQIVESQDTRKELTPIEEASRLNQKLKENYEARLARLPPAQARTQKTSLTLSLQRQMMENLIIAKARQDALQRKMEERRLRLQEEANRRFAASGTITAEEQEQRVLYTNVLEYEQDHDWPKLWKANIKKNPDDPTLVSGLVSCLLSCPDHPVMMLLKRLQYRVYNRLYPIVSKSLPTSPALPMKPSHSAQSLLMSDSHQNVSKSEVGHSMSSDASLNISFSHDHIANEEDSDGPHTLDRENSFEDLEQFLTQLDWAPSHGDPDVTFEQSQLDQEEPLVQDLEMRDLKEHLKAIVKDIHIAIDQLLSLCLLSFECLNTASSKDLCVASIEEAFFTPLWSSLLALFRKVHRERELSFESSMRLYRDASPGDVGVASKLYPQDPVMLHGSYPYDSAVQELRLLCKDCCPQRKLECIVGQMTCCPSSPMWLCTVSCLSWCRSVLPWRSSFMKAQWFGSRRVKARCGSLGTKALQRYLIGEEGYCLTSMQSALQYVESLHTGGFQLHNTKFT